MLSTANPLAQLENDFPELHTHLNAMLAIGRVGDRDKCESQLSLLSAATIVLSAKKAIVDHVTNKVPTNTENIFFIIGMTGAGKTTTALFLSGETMKRVDDYLYESTVNTDLIDHKKNSCTFVPNVVDVNRMKFVDFGGFNDNRGKIISCGMEFALKELFSMYSSKNELTAPYSPKVLVIESLNNTGDRYYYIAQLGQRLKRIFINSRDALLGLTKYAKNIHVYNIKNIKREQRQQLRIPIKSKIAGLKDSLEDLEDLLDDCDNESDAQKIIKKKESIIEEISKAKMELKTVKNQKLPSSPAKTLQQQHVAEIEKEILQQVDLSSNNMIRLSDLEKPKVRATCLDRLSADDIVGLRLNPTLQLDCYDEAFFQKLFTRDLENGVFDRFIPENAQVNSLESLRSCVESNQNWIDILLPEKITTFLRLPEMDPQLLIKFNKQLIEHHCKKVNQILANLKLISAIEKCQRIKAHALAEEITSLLSLLKGLAGINSDDRNSDAAYKCHQDSQRIIFESLDELFEPLAWVKSFSYIPFVIPEHIYRLSISTDSKPFIFEKSCIWEIRGLKELLFSVNKMALLMGDDSKILDVALLTTGQLKQEFHKYKALKAAEDSFISSLPFGEKNTITSSSFFQTRFDKLSLAYKEQVAAETPQAASGQIVPVKTLFDNLSRSKQNQMLRKGERGRKLHENCKLQ